MPYVRVSLMRPLRGRERDARAALHNLVDYYAAQPGYVAGWQLDHVDGSERLGRIGVWQHEDDAERAALTEHDIALRAALNAVIEEATHEEYSFEGSAASLTP